MKAIKNLAKRGLALLLVLMMCVGMLFTTAFAAGEDDQETHSHNSDAWGFRWCETCGHIWYNRLFSWGLRFDQCASEGCKCNACNNSTGSTVSGSITLVFNDGCDGTVFPEEKYTIKASQLNQDPENYFEGRTDRDGYVFTEWDTTTVKDGDNTTITYTAQWKCDGNHKVGSWTSAGDQNHTGTCTKDNETVTEDHVDTDTDHKCDECGAYVGEHTDNDNDHYCDYCKEKMTGHVDGNGDHYCDTCEAHISGHVDADDDHCCDICKAKISGHVDDDDDHYCDICDAHISGHVDADDDHLCDVCDTKISGHVDGDNDHLCDICKAKISGHVDADDDHYCDTCEAHISGHVDADDDHLCDVCDTRISGHVDADDDHLCDVCDTRISGHVDADDDHICDVCDIKISGHVDEDKNHKCDVCGADMGEHADADNDGDHKCDYCDETITDHTPGHVENNGDGTHTIYCEECDAEIETEAHNYGRWNVTTPATATENGVQTRTCTDCGAVQRQTIPATGVTPDPDDSDDDPEPVEPAEPTEPGDTDETDDDGLTDIPEDDVPLAPGPGAGDDADDDDLTDIPEDDVPLAPAPGDDADDGLVDLPEDDVPLADAPKTGDNSGIWVFTAALSATGLAVLTLIGKRREEDEEA